MPDLKLRTTIKLGAAQTLAWASSYYVPAVLAAPMAQELGLSVAAVFGAFSMALVISAVTGPGAGHLIDRHGGRPVLMASSIVFALGLAAMAWAQGGLGLFVAWALMGLGMGCGLYDAAFATLVRQHGQQSRGAITGVTLMSGFASTVGWPLSAWMASAYGWRAACLVWAALHIAIGLGLYASLPATKSQSSAGEHPPAAGRPEAPVPMRTALLLAFVFASTWFTSTAMAAHLPRVLQAAGATLAAAVLVGALIGPAQVGARLLEYGLLRRHHPLWSARLASLGHPVGVLLLAAGPAFGPAFAILHGMGNGIMTIASGALPLALFGAAGYGARQGWLMLPARAAQAIAPFAFGLLVDRWGAAALFLTALLGTATGLALLAIRPEPQKVQGR